jgi:GTPase SAR1 family protein
MCGNLLDQWRVTALGDGAVGKTSIAVQFTLHSFTGKQSVSGVGG